MTHLRLGSKAHQQTEAWARNASVCLDTVAAQEVPARRACIDARVTPSALSGDDGEMASALAIGESAATVETTRVSPHRVLSVDVLRGLTIAFMILVNDPGDWNHVFEPLDHVTWNGWTPTDLVFPTFLFLIGASMVFSMESRTARGDCAKTQAGHIFLRTGKLLLLEFVLVFFPRMQWHGMRIYGVLTRIALCYCAAGLILLAVRRSSARVKWLTGITAVVLLGYWTLLRWVPVPGAGMPGHAIPFLDQTQNLTAWVDRAVNAWTQRWLHTGRLYNHDRDPEGLLSTLPAIASVLLGSLAGMWMRRPAGRRGSASMLRMQKGLAVAGLVGLVTGELWSFWFPINKNLWTSSYVLLAAGWALLALAGLSWLVDRREEPWPRWLNIATWPWFVFGSNAIVAFAMSGFLVKALTAWKLTDSDGDKDSMWATLYEVIFARDHSTNWTSLAFGITFVGVCFLPNWFLWRRRWFVKL